MTVMKSWEGSRRKEISPMAREREGRGNKTELQKRGRNREKHRPGKGGSIASESNDTYLAICSPKEHMQSKAASALSRI